MPYFSTTLSSAGVTTAANLNWIGGKPTTVSVTASCSTQTTDFIIQYTLDDIQRVASTSVTWQAFSSAFGTTAQHFTSSASYPDGVTIGLLSPAAAVRINSTTFSGTSLFLKVVQGE